MDSGNSGSLQSSSGGDEEYNSRAANSMFISNQFPPSIFDPFSSYSHVQQYSYSPVVNTNMAWPVPVPQAASLRSESEIHPMMSSSTGLIPSFQKPAMGTENIDSAAAQNQIQTARNPKKRSRASRRAPTTVLTTDTTNFRAMVQEFTGIPAPSFSNSSSFPRTRLDLFSMRSNIDAGHPPSPPYLRRPFTQKVQSSSPFQSTSSPTTTNAASSSTPLVNYQPQIPQNSIFFNPQNPLLNSLLQTNPNFLLSSSSTKNHPTGSHVFPSGGLDEFSLEDGNNVGGNRLIGTHRDHNKNTANAENWRNSSIRPDESEGFQAQISSVNGNVSYQKNPPLNINYSASSNFQREKGPENIAGRGEGTNTVDSWIFSSD